MYNPYDYNNYINMSIKELEDVISEFEKDVEEFGETVVNEGDQFYQDDLMLLSFMKETLEKKYNEP